MQVYYHLINIKYNNKSNRIQIDIYVIHLQYKFQIKIIKIKKLLGIYIWLLSEKVET